MKRISLPLAPACLLLSLGASACASAGPERDVIDLVRDGRYAEAVELAEDRAQGRPNDAEAQQVLRRARTALLLDRGRSAVFDGRLEEGLRIFEQANELDPEPSVVSQWIEKTRLELAERWLVRAQGYSIEDLDAAAEAYDRVLTYDPDNVKALQGLGRVTALRNYRGGRSLTYYREGVESFERLALDVSQRAFGISDHLEENVDARDRQRTARDLLAQERLAQARSMESEGSYFAAKTEYRLALRLDPTNKEARAGYDRMDREGRAIRKLDEAEMHTLRRDLDKAAEAVDQASVLTDAQTDAVSKARSEIEDAHFEEMYEAALSLERDRDYVGAIAAYDRLLGEAEFFRDAIARRDTLRWFASEAGDLYEKALGAKDDAEAYDYLTRIEGMVWPGYKDVRDRLDELERRGVGEAPRGDGGGR